MDRALVALLLAAGALIVSILAVCYSRRQALAAEAQASEARLTREGSEKALGLQARALETQAQALQSQAVDTAKALEIAARSADAAQQSAEATKRLAGATEYRNIV